MTDQLRPEPLHLSGERWRRRLGLSWVIRWVAVMVPLGASIATGVAVSRVLPQPEGALATIVWFAAILIGSLLVLVGIDRFARRLLPLAMLLRLSLVFPDRAPSRLGIALRAASARRLASIAQATKGEELLTDPATVLTLAAALNAHDRRTRGHSERVRALSDLLGEELQLTEDDAERLRWAAFLHDIGKLTVPAKLLNKPGKLDAREWGIMRSHPAAGQRFTATLHTWLGEWVHAVDQHHEKFDGSGYPGGLSGNEISMAGRVVAVADSFETMTAVRSYSKPRSAAQARAELTRCAGTHFDPQIVRAMLGISVGRLRWTMGAAAWVAQLPLLGVPARAGAQVVTSAAGVEAGTGSVIGALAVSLAGVATPLGVAAAAVASVHADPPAPVNVSQSSKSDDNSTTVVDNATATVGDEPGDIDTTDDATSSDPAGGPGEGAGPGQGAGQGLGGPGAGSGPGNGAGQGAGGPGAGSGPGQGAAQGGGIPAGGVGNGNGNAGGQGNANGVPNGGVGQGQSQGQGHGG